MKKLLNILLLSTSVVLVGMMGCEKLDDLPYYGTGNEVTLTASKTTVAPTAANADEEVISFSWTSPKYKTDSSNYKFVLEIDSTTNNFGKASTKTVLGTFSTSFTGAELNNILLNYGFALGQPYEMDVRVLSSYSNNNEQYASNVVKISVTPYGHSAVLSSEKTAVTGTLANANQPSNTFSWTPAFVGYTGAITYAIESDAPAGNFNTPYTVVAGANLLSLNLTVMQMNEAALAAGITPTQTGNVKFRLKATTAQGAVSYSEPVTVTVTTYLPIQKIYLVGSPNGWNIGEPLELINDKHTDRFNKVFYTYIKLNANDEFKFAKTPGDWGSCYGDKGTAGTGFSTGFNEGGNFKVNTAGIYRLTIDIEQNIAYVQEKQVGVVGAMQGWNASAPWNGGYLGRDKFMIIVDNGGADQFKFHDGPSWDFAVDKARWWGNAGNGNLNYDGGDPNLEAQGTPRSRLLWDGEDKMQLKYEMSPAAEMRVVGNGVDGVPEWDPGASPQMTYEGNGVWTITLNLLANKEIKFLAGNAWGAFDYEDNSGGSTAVGTPRGIKWTGGDNFKTPTTNGSYKITLNEYNQTVTIE